MYECEQEILKRTQRFSFWYNIFLLYHMLSSCDILLHTLHYSYFGEFSSFRFYVFCYATKWSSQKNAWKKNVFFEGIFNDLISGNVKSRVQYWSFNLCVVRLRKLILLGIFFGTNSLKVLIVFHFRHFSWHFPKSWIQVFQSFGNLLSTIPTECINIRILKWVQISLILTKLLDLFFVNFFLNV